ncbi:putative WD repeat-containing protein alr3466 [Nostoc sp, PCC 7120] [Rhizoctonia solani]|uniref:Putative WD repeat-containing protein alr3466 [Nostoc sp, PCC 7120] n=1 Tax=Rhizoctonia solani TaxID=456999 RepID=A0A0K6GH57_9AGAM|nr:putative WD repeat-containing protein alr3466 [Nostoc sp, PCC 7120] [Rhizoctonia solani]
MDPDESNSRRKRPGLEPASLGRWLHPGDSGEWRGSKKARSVSGSRSPSPSGAPSSSEVGTNEPGRISRNSRGLARLLPRSQEHNNTSNRRPSAQPPYTIPRDPGATNATTSTRNSIGIARLGLEEAFRKLRIVTDTVCPPLCSTIDDLTACLHLFETAASNYQEYNDLTDELKSLVEQLIRHLHTSPSEEIADSIANISEAIRKEIESIGVRQSRGGIQRRLDTSGDSEDLDRRYRRIRQLFQQILGEASMSTWNITSEHFMNTQLEALHPAKLARFDSSLSTEINRRTCTENTRTQILAESLTWSEDPNGAKIYWMNGMAGTGKTTIAATFSTALEARKQLAATFFCTRTSPECREAKRIIPTLAYQFARRSTPFRSALSKALKEDPDIGTGSISSQFELLLRRPLIKAKDKLPNNLVMVVDALDECTDPYIVELFLNLLFRSIVDLPIKFYVTSRPEPAIRNKMMSESERARSILYLHEIEKSLVRADIELYLMDELGPIKPTILDIKKLAEHADNLFIYAATAVRYIRPMGKTVDSQARLSTILAVNVESKKKLVGIDALYSAILTAAINDSDLEPEEQERILLVLRTAICACEPIAVETLSALCGLNNENSTANALQPLRSVLHVSDQSGLVTTLHASFPDYMLTQERSGLFFCDKSSHSQLLARRCFEIMQAQLRFNICSIKSLSVPDNQIPNLEDRIRINISEELFYACRFWVDHLCQTPAMRMFLSLTHTFLSKQLLFWMEVLNLKGFLTGGVKVITKLHKHLLWNDSDPELLELASSASRFLINYVSSPASAYTPHLYISMLPFISSSSPLHSYYLPRFKGLAKASGTLVDTLEKSALSSWRAGVAIQCAAFCPTTDLIALGSITGEISVRNAYNGRHLVKPYKAHNANIQCLEVSSDGMWLLSSSYDRTLCIWSMQDGSLISGPYRGHTDSIRCVKLSLDGMHLVAGFGNGTVGIWGTYDATMSMRCFIGHNRRVNSVDFSPDGTRIASGSKDGTIRIWDVSSGATLSIISCPEPFTPPVNFARYTPDGVYIISAFSLLQGREHIFYTLDAIKLTPYGPKITASLSPVSLVAVSPERSHIAFVSSDETVCVWDRHTGKLISSPIPLNNTAIEFLAFSDDGMRIVTAYSDAVKVWSVYSGTEQADSIKTIGVVRAKEPYFTISPNRARIAEISESGINIWDSETAVLIASIPVELKPGVLDYGKSKVAISPQFLCDGNSLFSICKSGELYTWNTHTTKLVDGPHLCSTSRARIDSIACSSDGTRVVTCYTGKIELWDVQLHRSITYLELFGYNSFPLPPKVTFSETGRKIFTNITYNSQITLHVWDADNGKCLAGPFLGAELLDISPDGSIILTGMQNSSGTPRSLCIINVASGEPTYLGDMSYSNNSLWEAIFSTDHLYVIAASSSTCEIRSMRDHTITSIKPVWTGRLISFVYSSDGWCQAYTTTVDQIKPMAKFQSWRFRANQPFGTTIDSDGWLRDSESQHLLWVPQQIREDFPKENSVLIKNGESLRVDYSDMLLGDEWSECYIGD